jgi:glycosyltransferase involved in cell wall biosynthesis
MAKHKAVVSVVIPCYNQGRFLATAIESVLNQSIKDIEIIIVDDGSTDGLTSTVAQSFDNILYIHQQNKGLSAARNTGVEHCSGEYVLFLDADDWLLPGAIATNVAYLAGNPDAAFVSGAYMYVMELKQKTQVMTVEVDNDHYRNLLQRNYIGMIAAVLFRRAVIGDRPFDESLRACEDYDLYLRIARNHAVIHHQQVLTAYRRHTCNMSYNYVSIIACALEVLRKQRPHLRTAKEQAEYRRAYRRWYAEAAESKSPKSFEDLAVLLSDPLMQTIYTFPSLVRENLRQTDEVINERQNHLSA